MIWKIVASWRTPSVGIAVLNYEAHESAGTQRIERGRIKLSLTFKNGGAPLGNLGYKSGWKRTLTDPPTNDQKFSGCAFCQSYQILSIIW